jgi:CRISPR-associated exonuclease Cas4
MLWLVGLAVMLILAGGWALRQAVILRHKSGLPSGRLIYADTPGQDWQLNHNPLYSPTHHLTGTPDYLVNTARGIIPVEIKSTHSPDVPYLGHLLQLVAYCLLVEETSGHSPPHGLLKYADALYEVDFTPELRRELLDTLADMRQSHLADAVHRNHEQPGKCRTCGFYKNCGEAL